jgi:hypothetical protein
MNVIEFVSHNIAAFAFGFLICLIAIMFIIIICVLISAVKSDKERKTAFEEFLEDKDKEK